MHQRLLIRLGGALLLATSLTSQAEDFGPSIYAGMNARFDPTSEADFSAPQAELRHLLTYREANRQTNHFCLLGYRWPDGHAFVSVHWREGGLIMRWYGGTQWQDDNLLWAIHKGVDLQTGVIDADDPQGSTFLETRRDAEGTLEDCRRHGRQYLIEPFTPPPAKVDDY